MLYDFHALLLTFNDSEGVIAVSMSLVERSERTKLEHVVHRGRLLNGWQPRLLLECCIYFT